MSYAPGTALSDSIPFPTGGWNAKDPVDQMEDVYALTMENIFPEERNGRLRKGSDAYCTISAGDPVKTLVEYRAKSGTRKMLAACDGQIWDVSTSTPSSIKSGLTNDAWQTLHMRDVLLFFNGDDQPQQYNGSISDAVYTGIPDDATIIQGFAYHSQLLVIPKNSQSFWYLPTNSITGVLAEFDLSSLLTRGGSLMWGTTWTRESGAQTSELAVFCSSEGEVLVYAGSSPASDFVMIGHIFLSKPIGRRSFLNLGTEVEILTQTGVVPLSLAVANSLVPGQEGTLTDKISPVFNAAAVLYQDNGGWESAFYPFGKKVIYNVPSEANTNSFQCVRNALTGAWCKFNDWKAYTFAVYNDDLYFGGMDGIVYSADTGSSDNDLPIVYNMKTAFNYLRDREHVKHVKQIRPIIDAEGDVTLGVGVDVDFEDLPVVDQIEVSGALGPLWNITLWNTALWGTGSEVQGKWAGVESNIGRAIAVKFQGSCKDVTFALSSIHLNYDTGGYL